MPVSAGKPRIAGTNHAPGLLHTIACSVALHGDFHGAILFSDDRVLLRSVFLCIIAVAGVAYELIKAHPPRWLLIAGYAVVVGLALYRIATRPLLQDQTHSSKNFPSTHETNI